MRTTAIKGIRTILFHPKNDGFECFNDTLKNMLKKLASMDKKGIKDSFYLLFANREVMPSGKAHIVHRYSKTGPTTYGILCPERKHTKQSLRVKGQDV